MSDSVFFSKSDFYFADTFTDIRLVYSSSAGHTEVYSARKALKRFALKALKPEFRKDPFYEGMLRKEFEIGFRLEHPSVIRTYSFEEVEGLGACVVLEWVDGETMATLLENQTLDEHAWRKAALELCDALEYLEKHQIVHRDIKPSNVMLTSDGYHAKLIDFGFADSPEYGALKVNGGTIGYTAPEQLSNARITSTADIYAMGKIMEVLPVKKNRKYRSLVARMTSELSAGRPQTAREIKEELGKAFAGGRRNIYFLIPAAVVVAFVALFFIIQRKDTLKINVNTEKPTEIAEPAVDTAQTAILPPAEIRPPVKNPTESKSSVVIEETTSDEKDTSGVKTPQKVVHWMVILTAQRTRGLAGKLRAQGDTLWDEHTRTDIEAWVDSQTDSLPELRKDCYEEIQRNIEKIKRGG